MSALLGTVPPGYVNVCLLVGPLAHSQVGDHRRTQWRPVLNIVLWLPGPLPQRALRINRRLLNVRPALRQREISLVALRWVGSSQLHDDFDSNQTAAAVFFFSHRGLPLTPAASSLPLFEKKCETVGSRHRSTCPCRQW